MAKLSKLNPDDRKQALNSMWNEISSSASERIGVSDELGDPDWTINFGCWGIDDES